MDDIVKGLPNERSLIFVPVASLGFKGSALPNNDKAMTSRQQSSGMRFLYLVGRCSLGVKIADVHWAKGTVDLRVNFQKCDNHGRGTVKGMVHTQSDDGGRHSL